MDGMQMNMYRKTDRQTNMIIDMLMQPPLLENLLGIVLGLWMNGSGSSRKFPANFANAQQGFGLPLILLVGVSAWLILSLAFSKLAVIS